MLKSIKKVRVVFDMASQKCKECCQIKKKLCECCEDKCVVPLKTSLLFCNFDKKVKKVRKTIGNGTIKSVDCIRIAEDGTTILLEIKNQPPKNIEISEVAGKINDTMLYLFNNNYELLQNSKIKFFLAIPEKKYKEETPLSKISPYMQAFANSLVECSLQVFNDSYYQVKVEDFIYHLNSRVILCEQTDVLCA